MVFAAAIASVIKLFMYILPAAIAWFDWNSVPARIPPLKSGDPKSPIAVCMAFSIAIIASGPCPTFAIALAKKSTAFVADFVAASTSSILSIIACIWVPAKEAIAIPESTNASSLLLASSLKPFSAILAPIVILVPMLMDVLLTANCILFSAAWYAFNLAEVVYFVLASLFFSSAIITLVSFNCCLPVIALNFFSDIFLFFNPSNTNLLFLTSPIWNFLPNVSIAFCEALLSLVSFFNWFWLFTPILVNAWLKLPTAGIICPTIAFVINANKPANM